MVPLRGSKVDTFLAATPASTAPAASYPSLPPSARGLLFLCVSPPSLLSIIRTGVHGLRTHLDSPGRSHFVIFNDICKTFPKSSHSWVPGRYIFW